MGRDGPAVSYPLCVGRTKQLPLRAEATFAERTKAIDDPTGPVGIRLIPQRGADRVRFGSDRACLVLPLEASIVEAMAAGLSQVVDRSSWLLVPAGILVVLKARSPVARTVALAVSTEQIDRMVAAHGADVDGTRCRRYLERVQLLPRTTWVNELCHRYLFERAVCGKRDNDATRFLETELVKELYFLCHERQHNLERPSLVVGRTTTMQRALRHVEDHLFETEVLTGLARASGASASTLLRAFKREVGEGPQGYVRARRLDESLLLLKSHRHSVGGIARLVGYGNLAAFSHAFRARFGVRPSDVKRDTAPRGARPTPRRPER